MNPVAWRNVSPNRTLIPLVHHFVMPCRAVDGTYDGRTCRNTIARRDAAAFIPPGRNVKQWKKDSPRAGIRNEALRAIGRVDRTFWRLLSSYRGRSRFETKLLWNSFRDALPADG